MITRKPEEVKKDASALVRKLKRAHLPARVELISCQSQIGGGSLPMERLSSYGAAIHPEKISVPVLEERMRHLEVPIIPRVVNDTILIDARTLQKGDGDLLVRQLKEQEVLEP